MRKKLSQYFVPVTLALGAALRLLLIVFPRNPDDDSDVYLELGRNLFHHGTYGIADDGTVYPSLFRLPGYPIFMALHGGHTLLILLTQTVLDLLTCWLLYRMMLRERGETAARWTLALSSLCLFTAAYAATPLAESLSITCVGTAMYALARYLRERSCAPLLILCCGVAMYLRPDGVLLTAAVGLAILLHGHTRWTTRIAFTRAVTIVVLATLTLLPWTVRNWRTFHVFQPIAPRHVNDPGEPVNLGFYRWVRTFADDLTTTGNVFWAVGTRPIVFEKLPANACDTTAECVRTKAILDEYNRAHTVDAALDAKFGALAADRIAHHPFHYYVTLPLLRAADMWLRPRTEAFHADAAWWQWREHPDETIEAVALGLLGIAYIAAALYGFTNRPPLAAFCIAYLLMRTALIATMENAETRYTLEAFPIVFICAAMAFSARGSFSAQQSVFAASAPHGVSAATTSHADLPEPTNV